MYNFLIILIILPQLQLLYKLFVYKKSCFLSSVFGRMFCATKNRPCGRLAVLLFGYSFVEKAEIPVMGFLEEAIEGAVAAVLNVFKIEMLVVGKFRMRTQ